MEHPTMVFHASHWIPDCEDSGEINLQSVHEKFRFALLAILYGWLQAQNRQFLYEKPSKLVYSHDHGHFFPNGPNWKRSDLENPPTPSDRSHNPKGLRSNPI
jgi:hypothetical protein